ncbi:hypothetical protein JB92DRAFT_451326 [Gautieria morchelliformis]|nr:hypothetical protein JB92DRAFT_451326 [Gautieria morchelliformis]
MPVTLVEDLVPIILDLTYWTNTELTILSLVSSAWLHSVRRRLYRHPTITSVNQCRYLVRTLKSVEALQCLVKGINLWLGVFTLFSRDFVSIRFVLGLEGLDCVSFVSSTAASLMKRVARPESIRRIIILPTPRESRRRMDRFDLPFHPAIVEWHPKVAEKFIFLKKLAISGAELRITPSPHATPNEFHLSHFIISQCNIIHGSLPQLLSPASWSHLRNLTIITDSGFAPHLYGISTILSYCRRVLQCFHLEYRRTIVANSFIPLDGLFQDALEGQVILVSLRRLHLVDVVSPEGHTTLQKIGQRCPHLEVFKITGRHWPSFMLRALAWPVDISAARLIFPRLTLLEGPGGVYRVDGEDLASNFAAADCDEEW